MDFEFECDGGMGVDVMLRDGTEVGWRGVQEALEVEEVPFAGSTVGYIEKQEKRGTNW